MFREPCPVQATVTPRPGARFRAFRVLRTDLVIWDFKLALKPGYMYAPVIHAEGPVYNVSSQKVLALVLDTTQITSAAPKLGC